MLWRIDGASTWPVLQPARRGIALTMLLFSGVFNAPFRAFDDEMRAVIPVGRIQTCLFELRPGRPPRDVVLCVQRPLVDGAHGFAQVGIAKPPDPLNADLLPLDPGRSNAEAESRRDFSGKDQRAAFRNNPLGIGCP